MNQTFKESIENALKYLKQGQMIILVDAKNRENEGDLLVLADHVTPEHIIFMANKGKGLICVPITQERAQELELSFMSPHKECKINDTAFTYSVDFKVGTTTGVSAFDRAKTAKAIACKESRPLDFKKPGHMFPLIGHPEGLEKRQGHTEGSIELARLAQASEVAIICEIMQEDGHMMRMQQLQEFAKEHNLPIVSIQEIIEYKNFLKLKLQTQNFRQGGGSTLFPRR